MTSWEWAVAMPGPHHQPHSVGTSDACMGVSSSCVDEDSPESGISFRGRCCGRPA